MTTPDPDTLLWPIRAYIYGRFAAGMDDEAAASPAPTAGDIAAAFAISTDEAARALLALHDRHALFLEPGTTRIRLANPFSAIPTPYTVRAGGRAYWANCAWDCFGVVAALHAPDATLSAACAATGDPVRIEIAGGRLAHPGREVVHFLVPFRHWYDDLIHT